MAIKPETLRKVKQKNFSMVIAQEINAALDQIPEDKLEQARLSADPDLTPEEYRDKLFCILAIAVGNTIDLKGTGYDKEPNDPKNGSKL